MAQVPLNKFVRASTGVTTTLTQVYSAPVDTAAIMLTVLAANVTSNPQTISLGVSGNGDGLGNVSPKPFFYIVKDFQLSPNDVTNLAVGKIVIDNYDCIIASAGQNGVIDLTLSILETLNTSTITE
jgi:hypothetical protein